MPRYDYRCTSCAHDFEVSRPAASPPMRRVRGVIRQRVGSSLRWASSSRAPGSTTPTTAQGVPGLTRRRSRPGARRRMLRADRTAPPARPRSHIRARPRQSLRTQNGSSPVL
jgi:hypothetical protein